MVTCQATDSGVGATLESLVTDAGAGDVTETGWACCACGCWTGALACHSAFTRAANMRASASAARNCTQGMQGVSGYDVKG